MTMKDFKDIFNVYIINVYSQNDRRESAQQQALDFGFVPFFVEAVTTKDSIDTANHFVSQGVRAVWLSHMKAMKMFLKTKHEFAIIAEDDFKITNPILLRRLLSSKKILDYDFVQFGYLKPGIDTKISIYLFNSQQFFFKLIALVSKLSFLRNLGFANRMRVRDARLTPLALVSFNAQPGAHFYLISREFASCVISLNNPQFLSIDDFFSSLARMRSFRMCRTRQSLVSQGNFPSWSGDRFLNQGK